MISIFDIAHFLNAYLFIYFELVENSLQFISTAPEIKLNNQMSLLAYCFAMIASYKPLQASYLFIYLFFLLF